MSTTTTISQIQKNIKGKRELPEGWRWVKLGEVCETTSGGTPLKSMKAYYVNGSIPWIRSGEVAQGLIEKSEIFITEKGLKNSSAKLLPVDTVLVAMYGATAGQVGILKIESSTNQAVCGILPNEMFIPDFLYQALKDQKEKMISLSGGGAQPNISQSIVRNLQIPLPPLSEQRRIAAILKDQMAAVDKARAAAEARLAAVKDFPAALIRETLKDGRKSILRLGECLVEVKNGVGANWSKYPVLGATRDGLAPAKEPVGKAPGRYKLADPVTVFYNPMRILLGSIAMVDEGDEPGITSPDYVVIKGRPGVLDTRWFYYWFRSGDGEHLIKSLSRGAVRERILFKRLAEGEIEIPDYETQIQASIRMQRAMPMVETIEQELNTINALPAALLRRAFNGEL